MENYIIMKPINPWIAVIVLVVILLSLAAIIIFDVFSHVSQCEPKWTIPSPKEYSTFFGEPTLAINEVCRSLCFNSYRVSSYEFRHADNMYTCFCDTNNC